MGAARSRGFSLIELLFAVFILATAIIMVIAMFIEMVDASEKSVDLTSGTVVAEGLLNQTIYQIATDPSVNGPSSVVAGNDFWANTTAPPAEGAVGYPIKGNYTLNNTTFFYQIDCFNVALNYSFLSGGQGSTTTTSQTALINPVVPLGTTGATLKRLDCLVWWWGTSVGTTSTGGHNVGKLQVQLSRLIWPTAPY